MKEIKYSEKKLKILFQKKVLFQDFYKVLRQKMYGKENFNVQ